LGKELKIKRMDLSQIQYEPAEGELIQTPEGKYMIWHDSHWNEFQMKSNGIEIGLYDMNKQIIAQLPDLTDWGHVENILKNFDIDWNNDYYMMYGKEISYFTVFKIKEHIAFAHEVIDVVKNVGTVKAMDLTAAADAIEIWVIYNDEPTCLYLFPYDMGIVEVGE
jgi:hypothetical protein